MLSGCINNIVTTRGTNIS